MPVRATPSRSLFFVNTQLCDIAKGGRWPVCASLTVKSLQAAGTTICEGKKRKASSVCKVMLQSSACATPVVMPSKKAEVTPA